MQPNSLGKAALIIIFGGLAAMIMAGAAPAQERGGPVQSLYNPQTVETVSGLVVAITPVAQEGLPHPVRLTLKTERETLTVFLGPSAYLDRQGVKLADLDRIEVRGSRVILQGKPAIIAQEVKKGNQVLKLRDENGVPLWRGRMKETEAGPHFKEVYPASSDLLRPGNVGRR